MNDEIHDSSRARPDISAICPNYAFNQGLVHDEMQKRRGTSNRD